MKRGYKAVRKDKTMNLKEKIKVLSDEQRQKLSSMLKVDGHKYGVYPLTKAQYGLWCTYQIEPAGNSSFYNICCSVNLYGDTCVDSCLSIIKLLHTKHEALSYRFINLKSNTYQYIDSESEPLIEVRDFTDSPDFEKITKISEIENTLQFYHFDLTSESPIKYVVVKSSDKEIIVYFCIHHIISDGWSLGILVKTFLELYFNKNTNISINGFSDYIKLCNTEKYSDLQAQNLKFWKSRLKNTNSILVDKTIEVENTNSSSAEHYEIMLPGNFQEQVEIFSKKNHLSLQAITLCAFCVVMQRYYFNDSLNVGITFARRSHDCTRNMIGDLASIIPIPIAVDESLSVVNAIRAVNSILLEGIEHEEVEISDLIMETVKERRQDIQPLYQLTFAYHGKNLLAGLVEGRQEIKVDEVSYVFRHILSKFTNGFNGYVCVTVQEKAEGLCLQADYAVRYFDRKKIDVVLKSISNLLQYFISKPDMPVEESVTLKSQLAVSECDTLPSTSVGFLKNNRIEQLSNSPGNIAILDYNNNVTPIGYPGYLYYKQNGSWQSSGEFGIINTEYELSIVPEYSRIVRLENDVVDTASLRLEICTKYEVDCLVYYYRQVAIIIYSGNKSLLLEDLQEYIHTEHVVIFKTSKAFANVRNVTNSIASSVLKLSTIESVNRCLFLQSEDNYYFIYETNNNSNLHSEEITEIRRLVNYKNLIIGRYEHIPHTGSQIISREICLDSIIIPKGKTLTKTEDKLISIWNKILLQDSFTIYDKFYEIGGNSMLMMRLYQEINKEFEININIAELFVCNTIKDQAKFLDSEYMDCSNTKEEVVGMKF
ncbi:condensation domain-containing protein [Lachnospiraceae bacterium ZAX-1]